MTVRRLTIALALLALWLSSGWSEAVERLPEYARRLDVPTRGESILQPHAVVADLHTGEVFVADTMNNRILIFDSEGHFRFQIPGGNAFRLPIDLAVDPEGYIFVIGQIGGGIRLLDFDGAFIRRLPLVDLPGDAGEPRISSLALSPSGDRLYVLDTANHRLWIADREARVLDSVDFAANRSEEEIAQLRYGHVDVYEDTVLVAIPTDGLVHLFDLDGGARGTVGAQGSAECETIFPAAAVLDDQNRVIILDLQRALFMTWDLGRGVCLSEHSGFGNAPGALYQPSDLALDGEGRVYVSQGFEGRIQVFEGARPAVSRRAVLEPFPQAPVAGESAVAEVGDEELEPRLQPVEETPTAETIVAESSVEEPLEPLPSKAVVVPAPPEAPAIAAVPSDSFEFGERVAAGARLSVENGPVYDPKYAEIDYPGGDLPADRGAAVDLVVRAFRDAGVDLQEAIHQDIVTAPAAYGVDKPNTSIDHRRIRNLFTFFERNAASLGADSEADWAPGDLVFWDRDSDGIAGHLGVVTAETGVSGEPLVVHHHRPEGEFTGVPGVDVLARWPVVGHFRWSSESAEAFQAARLEQTVVAAIGTSESQPPAGTSPIVAVENTVRGWARAWSGRLVEEYLAFYSESFRPSGGLSRSEWEAQRRERLTSPRSIQVSLAGIDVRLIAEDRAEVSFVQSYRSNLFADKVDKMLVLEREQGGWKIRAERVLRTYRE